MNCATFAGDLRAVGRK